MLNDLLGRDTVIAHDRAAPKYSAYNIDYEYE